MGFLDNAIDKATPKGNSIAKPLMKAFIAALASGALTRKQAPAAPPHPSPASDQNAGSLLAGLGGLLEKLQQGGHGEAAKSWVGNEQNQAITPASLGSILGPSVIKGVAAKLGKSEEEVTTQLSQLLPSLVDKLTPQCRLPTQDEVAK
jgi:uncharacterized protein YidB (DUF937 family)